MDDDEEFDEWYPEAKVYSDGYNYIAIPHTENHTRRHKHKEESITVSEQGGKLKLEEKPHYHWQDVLIEDDTLEPPPEWEVAISKPIPQEPKSDGGAMRTTTRKTVFGELYEKYIALEWEEKYRAIYNDMLPLFKDETVAAAFVRDNIERMKKNVADRRRRFERKANNQNFNYFVTFTYDDKKQTEQSFKKTLLKCLQNFATRRQWKYMGVWERGDDGDRIHFHGLAYIPEGQMVGNFFEKRDYSFKTHQMQTVIMNDFFYERFGRNEFENLDGCSGPLFRSAVAYITKYMEKTSEKLVFSRGLYTYFLSDIQGEDVMCKLDSEEEANNKLVLSQNFTCWDEGVKVGMVSPETIAKMRKTN